MEMRRPDERAREEGFIDGVILALQILASGGDMGSPHYEELLNCADPVKVYRRAESEMMLRLSGLDAYVRKEFPDPAIRLRNELGIEV